MERRSFLLRKYESSISPTRKGVNLEELRDLEKRENRKEQERGRE